MSKSGKSEIESPAHISVHVADTELATLPPINKQQSETDKLLDFVEEEGVHSRSSIIPPHATSSRLSAANSQTHGGGATSTRLSNAQGSHLPNRQSKQTISRQSIFLASGLNFNYDDVMQDVVNIDDGKIVVQKGDLTKRYTIGPNMIPYLAGDLQKQVSEISKPLYSSINHWLAWFLVFYATINGACIPPWIMSIPAEKYIRISWRFFMQAIMMIPFLLYERRNLPENMKHQYTLSYIFKLEHIKKVYMVAFTNSIWFTMVLFAFEWSYISHALVLSGLQQFMFSIQRHFRKEENHNYESAGQAMVVLGVLCVFFDSITFDPAEAPPSTKNYRNFLVLFRKPWQRLVIGNFTAVLVSYLMFKMSRHQGESRKVYPQFLSMALVFAFTSMNMTMSSYFFAGSDLVQHDSFWGWMGLFTSTQFSGFLFMSIILGMGNFVSQTLISKIFEPIIPATVALFEPIFSTLILQAVGVQIIPRGLSCLGYVFILPGLFVIILGQHLISQRRKQEEEKLKAIVEEEEKKQQREEEEKKQQQQEEELARQLTSSREMQQNLNKTSSVHIKE